MNINTNTYIDEHRDQILDDLKRLVNIQSYSYNPEGTNRVVAAIQDIASELPGSWEIDTQTVVGNHLVYNSFNSEPEKKILILGHMDTVFPPDSPFQQFTRDDAQCYGPGVNDMKGGLIVGMYALKCLHSLGLLSQIPLTFIFNSDEEIGSLYSHSLIRSHARRSAYAFILEGGGTIPEIVVGRKGRMVFTFEVFGQAGHAAFCKDDKISAIMEMASKILQIEQMNAIANDVAVNVGTIVGGVGPNTVPDYAKIQIDIRYLTQDQKSEILKQLDDICSTVSVQGARVKLTQTLSADPVRDVPSNYALYHLAEEIARSLKLPVKASIRSGASDANQIAGTGIPLIDGLGPNGGNDHSEREFSVIESLYRRTVLFAELLRESWSKWTAGDLF